MTGALRSQYAGPFALNLVKAGFEVIVHDINLDRVAPLAEAGARVVDTPAAAAAECRRVPLFLANVSQQDYQMGRAAGFSKEDGSSLVKVYERLAGVKVSGGDGG